MVSREPINPDPPVINTFVMSGKSGHSVAESPIIPEPDHNQALARLEQDDFRAKTWLQIQKDARLSGISDFPTQEPADLPEMTRVLVPFLDQLFRRPEALQGFLYRVDLPLRSSIELVDINELAQGIIVRSFQKVWLRTQYSNTSGKPDDTRT